MRKHRTLRQRFADWLRYSVAERIDRDGSPKSAGASFTFEPGIGRVWHDKYHGGPGCPVWYLSEEDYQKAHTDGEESRPLQVGDEILMFPIIDGREAVRAMFDPHNPSRYPTSIDIPLDFTPGTFTPDGPNPELGMP